MLIIIFNSHFIVFIFDHKTSSNLNVKIVINNNNNNIWLHILIDYKCKFYYFYLMTIVFITTILPWYSLKNPAVPHKYPGIWSLVACYISMLSIFKCHTVWVYVLLSNIARCKFNNSQSSFLSLSRTRSCSLFLHVSCICALLSSTHTSSFLPWESDSKIFPDVTIIAWSDV